MNNFSFTKTLLGSIFNFKNNIGNILNTLIQISDSTPLLDMTDIKANLYIPKKEMLQAAPDMPRAMVTWEINKTIDGYVYLQKLGGKMFLTKDAGLESVEFNKEVLTYASSPKLPFYLLPPNLMSWYLDQEVAPVIYIKDKRGYVVFMTTLSKEEYFRISSELLKQIKRSGALN
jgi:hypothetical protein